MFFNTSEGVCFDTSLEVCVRAYTLMKTARAMADLYDERKAICGKYVHSTSKGHEAIQLAAAFHLTPDDYASIYYRDDSIMLGLGFSPYELMLQLMAKAEDPFSGGRTYYNHPSVRREGFPVIPHQSSATGMQTIPATGMAQGIEYLRDQGLWEKGDSIAFCSLGDGAVTEGEVSEAFQVAVLKKLPVLFLVQDNGWGISARGEEMHAMDAYTYVSGFKGMARMRADGSDFVESYQKMEEAFRYVRESRGPMLVHARCPLLGHHTSGVRREWYREKEEFEEQKEHDPVVLLKGFLLNNGFSQGELIAIEQKVSVLVQNDFEKTLKANEPELSTYNTHVFSRAIKTHEEGIREPEKAQEVYMVEAAMHAIDEILDKHPEAIFYGQDVGKRLGGVFREAATLAAKYGEKRVFNTPIEEAYIIGSTVGMSAVGVRPIVEIQFADYIWPGINQLVEEVSKSCYLSVGKFPVSTLIRVPTGAYGGGGPYHSGSIESMLLTIKGIKVVYPSNAADMKGLMKAAFYDPNPVIMLEHKGLYWSKVPGTGHARTREPDSDYIIPLGKAMIVREVNVPNNKNTALVIAYGMGVHWALNIDVDIQQYTEILDLRTLNPIDWELIVERVKVHNRVLIVTEEPITNSFAESLAGRIGQTCFRDLDAPVMTMGSADLPAIPLNINMEKQMLPHAGKLSSKIRELLEY